MGRLHLLRIPKTGSTALIHALEPHLAAGGGRIILHTHETRLADIPRGETVAFVVRDPAARFVSAFNHRLRRGRPRYTDVWTPAEAACFARFDTADALASALSDTDADCREAAVEDVAAIAHVKLGLDHWLGSVTYLRSRRRDIGWIGLTERLDQDFQGLKDAFGVAAEAALPTDAYQTNRGEVGATSALSPVAMINLRLWHRLEIDLYEECRQLMVDVAAGNFGPDQSPQAVAVPGPYRRDEAHSWTVALPPAIRALSTDDRAALAMYEDELRLLPGNAMQTDIRRDGCGGHAFWPELLCFSTSDNSDPNLNGRRYTVGVELPGANS